MAAAALGVAPQPLSEIEPNAEPSLERWSAQVQTPQRIELLPGLALMLGPKPSLAVTSAVRAIYAQYLG